MLLKDLLNTLINNELGNLAIGKPEWATGKFNYVSLIQCISLGYQELHKRFSLKKGHIQLMPMLGTQEYKLSVEHALSNSTSVLDKYLIDSADRPFSGNIAKIDAILDRLGEELSFNTTGFADDIKVLDYRTIFIKNPNPDEPIDVVYREIPPTIKLINEMELETYEIDLPFTYLEALLCYAAGRAYANRGAENATNNESAIFYARFEQACANVEFLGLNTKENTASTRFTARGFI